MPRKKRPCPKCGKPMANTSKTCRQCSKPYKRTPEHRVKMSQATKGKQTWLIGTKRTEIGKKISKAWTPEMRKAAKERGRINAESRQWLIKIAESLSGKSNPNYQGLDQETPYAPGWGRGYRTKIRARANGICEWCDKKYDKPLDLHHKDFSTINHDPDNLAVICRQCHKLAHAKHKRSLEM